MPTSQFPRIIPAELIEIGDKVRIKHRPKKGVTTILEGVVSDRRDHGSVRFLYTDEGATLVSWQPGVSTGITITLLDRPPAEQEPLSMFDSVERLAE